MDFEDEEFIKREQSDDLLFEAYDEPIKSKAIKLAKQALEINPDNIDAENFITKFEANTIKKLEKYKETLDNVIKTNKELWNYIENEIISKIQKTFTLENLTEQINIKASREEM